MDTLVLGCILPTTKANWELSPVRNVRRKAHNKKAPDALNLDLPVLFHRRSDVIRTRDLYVPNVALYQAEPHSDKKCSLHFPNYGWRTRTFTNRVRVCCAAITPIRIVLFFYLVSLTTRLLYQMDRKNQALFWKKLNSDFTCRPWYIFWHFIIALIWIFYPSFYNPA